jgi:hypothetical protein
VHSSTGGAGTDADGPEYPATADAGADPVWPQQPATADPIWSQQPAATDAGADPVWSQQPATADAGADPVWSQQPAATDDGADPVWSQQPATTGTAPGPVRPARALGWHPTRRQTWLGWTAFAVLVAAAIIVVIVVQHRPLLSDNFGGPNRLITNEFAYFNPGNPAAVRSPTWIVTSGSLFVHDNAGWTGLPDRGPTGPRSVTNTDSSVFRLITQRRDFQNVTVSFDLLTQRFVPASNGPTPGWQGVHVFLRYQSPALLYVVSVDRVDGVIVIKKKVPGGAVDGGSYYTLATLRGKSVTGRWEQVRVSVVNKNDSVQIMLWLNGKLRLQALDSGAGDVPPITQPGRVGIRGDYTEFEFTHFTVDRA